jgi:hypothetical protein
MGHAEKLVAITMLQCIIDGGHLLVIVLVFAPDAGRIARGGLSQATRPDMGIIDTIALSMGVGWASGLNLYAAILTLGYLGTTGHIALPPDLQILTDPVVLFAAGIMYCIEFFVDKTPGADTGWDVVHTFIRIPAGAVLAAGAVGDVSQAAEIAAFLIGGTLAAGSHAVKAGSRVLINTTPEPFTNWAASLSEDLLVIGGLWTALHHPSVFLGGLAWCCFCWSLPGSCPASFGGSSGSSSRSLPSSAAARLGMRAARRAARPRI